MDVLFKILKLYKYRGQQLKINQHPIFKKQNKKGLWKKVLSILGFKMQEHLKEYLSIHVLCIHA